MTKLNLYIEMDRFPGKGFNTTFVDRKMKRHVAKYNVVAILSKNGNERYICKLDRTTVQGVKGIKVVFNSCKDMIDRWQERNCNA